MADNGFFKTPPKHITHDHIKYDDVDIYVFSENEDPEKSTRFLVTDGSQLDDSWTQKISDLYCHLKFGRPNVDLLDTMDFFHHLYRNCKQHDEPDPDFIDFNWYIVREEENGDVPAFSFKLIRHVLHLISSIDVDDPLGRNAKRQRFLDNGFRLVPVREKPWYKRIFS
jgi:hypothetical protein